MTSSALDTWHNKYFTIIATTVWLEMSKRAFPNISYGKYEYIKPPK